MRSDPRVSKVVPEKPLIMSRKAPNLQYCLVKSHFSRLAQMLGRGRILKGSYPCGECTICQHMKPTNTFYNPSTGLDLWHYINCKSRAVIYAIRYPCRKIYIGQTTQELRKRIQKHLSTITMAERDARLGKTLTPIADHFLLIIYIFIHIVIKWLHNCFIYIYI